MEVHSPFCFVIIIQIFDICDLLTLRLNQVIVECWLNILRHMHDAFFIYKKKKRHFDDSISWQLVEIYHTKHFSQ